MQPFILFSLIVYDRAPDRVTGAGAPSLRLDPQIATDQLLVHRIIVKMHFVTKCATLIY